MFIGPVRNRGHYASSNHFPPQRRQVDRSIGWSLVVTLEEDSHPNAATSYPRPIAIRSMSAKCFIPNLVSSHAGTYVPALETGHVEQTRSFPCAGRVVSNFGDKIRVIRFCKSSR